MHYLYPQLPPHDRLANCPNEAGQTRIWVQNLCDPLHHHHHVRVASKGGCVTPVPWPRRMADRHNVEGMLPVSLRTWSTHLLFGRPGRRFQSRPGRLGRRGHGHGESWRSVSPAISRMRTFWFYQKVSRCALHLQIAVWMHPTGPICSGAVLLLPVAVLL